MKSIVIHRDEEKIGGHIAKMEEVLPHIQNAYNLFKEAVYFHKGMDLNNMFNYENHRLCYEKKIIEELAVEVASSYELERFPGTKAKTENLVEVENPPGFGSAVFTANEELKNAGFTVNDFSTRNESTLTDVGKVSINKKTLKAFTDHHSIKAETADEIAIHKALMEFIKVVEKLNGLLRRKTGLPLIYKPLHPVRIAEWFRHDPDQGYYIYWPRFAALKRALSIGPNK